MGQSIREDTPKFFGALKREFGDAIKTAFPVPQTETIEVTVVKSTPKATIDAIKAKYPNEISWKLSIKKERT